MQASWVPDAHNLTYFQLDNHLARERVKENVQVHQFHFETFEVSAYSIKGDAFTRRFSGDGSVCLACDKPMSKLRREAELAEKDERDFILHCYHCQLPISCVDEACRGVAEFFHEPACPYAELEKIQTFSRTSYIREVYKKIMKRKRNERRFGPETPKFVNRCAEHPFAEHQSADIKFYCYNCCKEVFDFGAAFSCQVCHFGVFCSRKCFYYGFVTNHSSSCVPRCFNPLCKRKGFKFFCCREAIYCSSRCFHVDLQHNLSQHYCSPQIQYLVFYHTPPDMGKLSRFFVEVLQIMSECKGDLFLEPKGLDLLKVQTRIMAQYYAFAMHFDDDVVAPLLQEKDIKFLFTRKAQSKYMYPYLLSCFNQAFVHCACPRDLIALYAYEDFFHFVTCKGVTVLYADEEECRFDFNIEAQSMFFISDDGDCFCTACHSYKFNFNYNHWKPLKSGLPQNISHGPIEALRLFLEFYSLHFNVAGVNHAHQIIHVFCTDRRKVLGYYKGPPPPKI